MLTLCCSIIEISEILQLLEHGTFELKAPIKTKRKFTKLVKKQPSDTVSIKKGKVCLPKYVLRFLRA
jgi:hypothetical protein